ncbi:hypothetical protein Patl1_20272 [Pistacia atlantica]|uniref:Uncharacterized protein n=1 Tax=Pistacia atlantica TaxID=434234 RepID=A0ACC1BIY8_9ROSI|nr:hypothetical protein Patl1_20272 [Pistacia atlantica]
MDMEGLSLICAGLGMDWLRFLKRDDPQTREVFKQVCKWNIVSKDLMPIIEHCQDDRNLVLNAVKVLVFLTMPVEPSSNDIPQQIEYLLGLKSSITCSDTIPVIASLLESPWKIWNGKLRIGFVTGEAFTEDDWKLVQLVLTLFRNVLAVQDIPLQQKAGGSAAIFISLRDGFLELLLNENVMDIILAITPHVGDPEFVASAHHKVSKVYYFMSLFNFLANGEVDIYKAYHGTGVYEEFCTGFTNASNFSFKKGWSKSSDKGEPGFPASASQNLVFKPHKGGLLHDLVDQFLSGSYNVLKQSIREDIEKEHQAIQTSDIIIFFRVAQLVTSFQYHKIVCSKLNAGRDTSEASTIECPDNTLFKGKLCGPIVYNGRINVSVGHFKMAYTGDSSDGEEPVATNEVDFKVSTFLSAFANCNIIHKLCWLLKFYKSNSNRTNYCIICMLPRIRDDLELSPMLYRLRFAALLLEAMNSHMNTCKECHYINAEYLLHELGNIKKKTEKWQNSLEVGDIGSSQANGWVCRSTADALGDDEADVVISHELGNGEIFFEGEEGMASSIVREVDEKEKSENGEIFMQKQSGKVSKRKRRLFLSDEWDVKISELYEKFKDDQNCSHLIAESLDADGKVSAAQVSNKLKQLGFKFPSKKRVRHTGDTFTAGPDEPGEEPNAFEIENNVHNSNDAEGSLLRQPLYKDHKRCSHMIANGLDGEKRLTASQVSH